MDEQDTDFIVQSQEKLREIALQLNESMLEGNQAMGREEYKLQGRGAVVYMMDATTSLIPNVSMGITSKYLDLDALFALNTLQDWQLDYIDNVYNPNDEYVLILFTMDVKLPLSGDVGTLYHFDNVKYHEKGALKDDYIDAKREIQKEIEDGKYIEKPMDEEEKSGITELEE